VSDPREPEGPESVDEPEAAESVDEPAPEESASARPAETAWERRRRLAAVFGDVLPETTRDERDPGEDGTSEDWLRRQVPPHHG
jgi:hypothetical protein